MPRHLAIGDIHGCFAALETLCEFVKLRSDDTIITLGDYPNRGENTKAVLDWILETRKFHNLIALRGNHDQMMQEAIAGIPEAYDRWIRVGGDATLRSYASTGDGKGSIDDIPYEHIELLAELLPYHEIGTHFFVHASAYPDMPLSEQPEFMLYWEKFSDPPLHESGKIMVCGHTSQKSGLPLTNGNAICIDTWAHGRGWLSCLDVGSGEIWQANNDGDTRTLWLDEL